MIAGAGSSCAAKKDENTAAMVAATAPSGQAVKIHKTQHSITAAISATPDSAAMPLSRCRRRLVGVRNSAVTR